MSPFPANLYDGPVSLIAAADLSTKIYFGVVISAARTVNLGSAPTTDIPGGVLQDKPDAAGQAASVQMWGVTPAIAGTGGVTAGAEVTIDANGRFVDATTGDFVWGVAISGVSNSGEQFEMLIRQRGIKA